MLKKTSLGVILVALSVLVVGGTIAQIISMKSNDLPLSMKAEIISGAVYSAKNIPVNVVFRNTDDKIVRLLNVFDDSKAKKIFFSISLSDSNGTPISTVGGGKISLSESSMKYIELKKGEEYTVGIDLKDFLPADCSLKPGTYNVSVIYRNQYGENCFKGSLESNTISLHLSE